jgi:hypothetical protein
MWTSALDMAYGSASVVACTKGETGWNYVLMLVREFLALQTYMY